MTDMTEFIVIEASRENSNEVKANGIEHDESKASWTNNIKPITLRTGDKINLELCTVNIRGANTNAIELSGLSNSSDITDTTMLIEVGFYINNNFRNNLPLPFKYLQESTKTYVWTDYDYGKIYRDDDSGITLNNASYGSCLSTAVFNYNVTLTNPPLCKYMKDMFSANPYIYADNVKYSCIDPSYQGWMRDQDTGNFSRKTPKLFTQTVQINLKPGFSPASSIADLITIQLNKTYPATEPTDEKSYNAKSFYLKSTHIEFLDELRKIRNVSSLNGSCFTTIPANFITETLDEPEEHHRIYSFLATDEPYVWLNGTKLISMTDVYDLNNTQGDHFDAFGGDYTGSDENNYRIFYPCFLKSSYNPTIHNLPDTNIIYYKNYGTDEYQPIYTEDGDIDILEITNYPNNPEYVLSYICDNNLESLTLTEPTNMLKTVGRDIIISNNLLYTQKYEGRTTFENITDDPFNNYAIINNTNWNFGVADWTKDIDGWIIESIDDQDVFKNPFFTMEIPPDSQSPHNHKQLNDTHFKIIGSVKIDNRTNCQDGNTNTFANTREGTYDRTTGEFIGTTAPFIRFELLEGDFEYAGLLVWNISNPQYVNIVVELYDKSDPNTILHTHNINGIDLGDFPISNGYGFFYDELAPLTSFNAMKINFVQIVKFNKGYLEQICELGVITEYDGVVGGLPFDKLYLSSSNSSDDLTVENFSVGEIWTSFDKKLQFGTWNYDYEHISPDLIFSFPIPYDIFNFSNEVIDPNELMYPFYNLIRGGKDMVFERKSFRSFSTDNMSDFRFITEVSGKNNLNYVYTYPNSTFYAITDALDDTQNATFIKTITNQQDRRYGRFFKNQIHATNIKATLNSLEIIKDWFDKCKIYDGNKKSKTDAFNDIHNYYVNCDLGRSDDSDLENPNGDPSIVPVDQLGINKKSQWNLYHKYKGTIGSVQEIDGIESNAENGVNFPRNKTYSPLTGEVVNNNQILKLRASYINDEPIETGSMAFHPYSYVTEIYDFNKTHADENINILLKYIKDNNLGCFLYKCRNLSLNFIGYPDGFVNLIGFYQYDEQINQQYYKIQNYTYFGFSPQLCDHNYVSPINNDMCAVNYDYDNTPDATGKITQVSSDFTEFFTNKMNYINVGATNPTLTFNDNFNKYQFSSFHTANYFNAKSGTTTNQGQQIASLLESSDNGDITSGGFKNLYINNAEDGAMTNSNLANKNKGINDSQSGIFINDIYFQRKTNQDADIINKIDDVLAIKATPLNWYNSLPFKLGFSYFDFMPLNTGYKLFNNRFQPLLYNNLNYKGLGVRPFTTNSDLSISSGVSNNLFDYLSDVMGQSQFSLGYSNFIASTFSVQSAFMNSSSIPVQNSSAYYRIYTDLPLDLLEYNAEGSNMSCIAIALRNYSSSSFYYSYGNNWSSQITKDMVLSKIKIEIRTPNGNLVNNLDEKSGVILKVERQVQIGIPEAPVESPELEELEKIDKDILKEQTETGNLSGVANLSDGAKKLVLSVIKHHISVNIMNTLSPKLPKDEYIYKLSDKLTSFLSKNLSSIKKQAEQIMMINSSSKRKISLKEFLKNQEIPINSEGKLLKNTMDNHYKFKNKNLLDDMSNYGISIGNPNIDNFTKFLEKSKLWGVVPTSAPAQQEQHPLNKRKIDKSFDKFTNNIYDDKKYAKKILSHADLTEHRKSHEKVVKGDNRANDFKKLIHQFDSLGKIPDSKLFTQMKIEEHHKPN